MSRSNARAGFSDGWCSGIIKNENFITVPLTLSVILQVAEKLLGVLRPFDLAQGRLCSEPQLSYRSDERKRVDGIDFFPFMLKYSKHSGSFFTSNFSLRHASLRLVPSGPRTKLPRRR